MARQRGEARQSYGRAAVGWPQLFPRRSAPKWRKIALKIGILSVEKMEVLQFFLQLNQAFSFGIVFWDSKLISHANWGKLGPF